MADGNFTQSHNSGLITAEQVASILGLSDRGDDYDAAGLYIAQELLSGKIAFKFSEVEDIAACLGLSVDWLADLDGRFAGWKNCNA